MKRRLSLDYSIGDLAIAPYLEGLRDGSAIAKQCGSCQRSTFPPERRCGCERRSGEAADSWKRLSGSARLIQRTNGPEGSFALVQFAGADNRAVCRISNSDLMGSTGTLQADKREIPGIVIMIVGDVVESAG